MSVASPYGAVPRDPAVVVREVLAQPGYANVHHGRPVEPTPIEQFGRWLHHMLQPFFDQIGRVFGHAHGAQTTIGFVLIGLALLGIAFVGWRVARSIGASREGALHAAHGASPGGAAAGIPAREFATQAARAARDRRYGEAIGLLFASALARLDEARLVRYDPARTVRAYARALSDVAAREPFNDLGDAFVRAAFAGHSAQRDDYEAARGALDRLDAALP